MIHRLRLNIEAEQAQLEKLESETLQEVLDKGPLEDGDFECRAVRRAHEGKIIIELQLSKRSRLPKSTHSQDPIEILHRLAMTCYVLVGGSLVLPLI